MPRIPQSEFDTNPSTRVEAPSSQMAPDALNNVGKQLGNLMGAAAQLQDQSERTEAYDYANRAKDQYNQKKIQYAAALETVDGSGMANYFDPTDQNPDMNKRKRISRPISEMQKEMIDTYEEQKKGLGGLTRGDIAGDLMRNYVGDDIMQLQMRTNKHINQVREKETRSRLNENMETNVLQLTEIAMDGSSSPEEIELALAQTDRKIVRELGYASPIIGDQGIKDYQKVKDKTFSQVATQLISGGVNNNTVMAADGLIKRISDPSERALAQLRVEKAKKTTATVTAMSVFSQADSFMASIANKAGITPEDKMKGTLIARQVAGLYTSPEYTPGFDPEKQKKKSEEILGTLLGKDILQKNMTSNLQWLDNIPADFKFKAGTRTTSGNSMGGIKASESAYDFIKKEEGFRSEAYDDGSGNITIGYGDTEGDTGTPVTKEEAESRMKNRVALAEKELSEVITRGDLTQAQQDVLVDMHYNLGMNNMQSFIKVVNEGTDEQIQEAMKKYVHAENKKTGEKEVLDGLVKRVAKRLDLWRTPAAPSASKEADTFDIEAAKLADLEDQINKEVETSGIMQTVGGKDLAEGVKKKMLETVRAQRPLMKDNLVDIIKAENPNITPADLFNKVQLVSDMQGFGDPKFASDKTQKEFIKNFSTTLAKDPDAAFSMFAQHTMAAGDKSRALAIDLVGKDSKYGFLIAAADAEPEKQQQMMYDASSYQKLIATTDITPNNLNDALTPFESQIPALAAIRKESPSAYLGIRQAIINRGAARLEGISNVSKDNVSKEIRAAIDDMKGLYTSMDIGNSTVLGVNTRAKNYGNEKKAVIEGGVEAAITLPQLKPEQKQNIFERFFPQYSGTKFSEERINWILRHGLRVVPDGRHPNMHKIQTNNGTDLSIEGEVLKVSMDDLQKWGQEKYSKMKQNLSQSNQNLMVRK